MSHPFVPILKTCPASSVSANSDARSAGEGFVPLVPGSAPVASPTPGSAALPEAVEPAGSGRERSAAAPVIVLKREGDQVTQVQIRCSCGEVIELSCVY